MEGCEFYMKWVMVALLIIVILLFIIIITRLTIFIDYRHSQDDDIFKLKCTFWFGLIRLTFNIPLVKIDKEAEMPAIVVESETKIGHSENQMNNQKQRITPEDIINRMKDIKELFRHIVKLHEIVKKFLSKVSILQFEWHSKIGTDDASHTGLLVGMGWMVKGSILGLISNHLRLRCTPSFSIHPFFQQFASETHLKCMIRFRVGNAMLVVIRLLKNWKGGRPHFNFPSMSTKKSSVSHDK